MAEQSEARTNSKAPERPTAGDERSAPAGDDAKSVARPLVATFDYAPNVPVVGDSISFEVQASGGNDRQYEWSFGDGTTATGARATHAYETGGKQEVTLTVTDDDGATDERRRSLTVYRTADIELSEFDREDGDLLLPVGIRGENATATPIRGESLRFGSPAAIAMGGGATPVRTAERDDGFCAWFRATDTAMTGTGTKMRLAGHTTDGVPLAGTADAKSVEGR